MVPRRFMPPLNLQIRAIFRLASRLRHGTWVANIIFLMILFPLTSVAGLYWSAPQSAAITKVCFGKDRFVAVGPSGVILWSTNGSTWYAADPQTSGTSSYFESVCFGNGYFIAVGWDGSILRSADGKSWTSSPSPTARTLSDVWAEQGRFVAVGEAATILVSADGYSWTSVGYNNAGSPGYPLDSLCSVRYGNGVWVALERSNTTGVRSTDGVNWTRIYSGNGYKKCLIFDGTRFVAVADAGGQLSTSLDGLTWQNMPAPRGLYSIVFGEGLYVAVGESGAILSSPDLITWTATASAPGVVSMAYGKEMFAAVGSSRAFSEDGLTWTVKSMGGTWVDLTATCFFKSKQYITGKSGHLSYYDFQQETIVPIVSGTNADLRDIASAATPSWRWEPTGLFYIPRMVWRGSLSIQRQSPILQKWLSVWGNSAPSGQAA
ncbi:MAG: hypothetical protein JWL90_1591 [Chthoniobacteraceae bacterium]|nr:hypothetical protein [Chthoniobacteraceae bacterium]